VIVLTGPKQPVIEFPSVLDRAYKDYKRHLKVEDIMSHDVCTTTPETPMAEAAKIMGTRHIGSLIVMKFKTPVAIVTERDLLSKVIACGLDLYTTLVKEVMSYPLIKICPTLEIREAARTMIHKKGRLAVFECGELAGVITASDLIREMPDAPETSLDVDEFMSKDIVSVNEDQTVATVAGIMGEKRVGSVIVNSRGKSSGIFTERDLLSKFIVPGKSLDEPVGKSSSSPLKTADAGISIRKAAKIMAAQHVRRLPLMKKKQIAGIITARDLVEAYAR
jgi:CBS domain-containing protein